MIAMRSLQPGTVIQLCSLPDPYEVVHVEPTDTEWISTISLQNTLTGEKWIDNWPSAYHVTVLGKH